MEKRFEAPEAPLINGYSQTLKLHSYKILKSFSTYCIVREPMVWILQFKAPTKQKDFSPKVHKSFGNEQEKMTRKW